MPWGLKRFQQSGRSHFVTFSCFHRQPLLSCAHARDVFEAALERMRRSYSLRVYGYVVMPEHAHVLVSEPERATLATALKSLKQGVSRKLIGDAEHFWQRRYYDFNIRDYEQFVEKLNYIHGNPVKRGLCKHPQDWKWSSFSHYATWPRRHGRNRIRADGEPPGESRVCASVRRMNSPTQRTERCVAAAAKVKTGRNTSWHWQRKP